MKKKMLTSTMKTCLLRAQRCLPAVKALMMAFLLMFLPMQLSAQEEHGGGEELDIPEIVLEHLSDAYEWHIASYQGKHLSIPLPIIVRSSADGSWHFCTAHSLPGQFFFNPEAHGKIYEKMPDGTTVRPLDLSFTKAVAQIWIVVIILIVVFLSCARTSPMLRIC